MAATDCTRALSQMIRLVRVLKVMKNIHHLAPLNRLVSSIGHCLIPMGMAFLILLLVQLVYSVLGVYLFKDSDPEYFGDLKT